MDIQIKGWKMHKVIAHALAFLMLWLGGAACAGTVTYVYTDAQNTPIAEADANGNIIARFDYMPYGAPVPSMGPEPDGPGYTGHVNDPDTGLVYMQARYYDPALGRFLSVDPVAPSPGNTFNFNRYNYANNNPHKYIDPNGEEGKVAWLVKLGASGMRKVARLTQEQAVRARRSGGNILGDRRQVSSQIETAAFGRNRQLKHGAHELGEGAKGLSHYQTGGEFGHSFWGKLSGAAIVVTDMLDEIAEASEYIPDLTPRPASNEDVSRFNNITATVGNALGVDVPRINNHNAGGFQGVFRVDGRIDSKRLNDQLSNKK